MYPVTLITYNRPFHTYKTLEALSKNPQAKSKDPNTKLLEKELSELLGSAVQITHNSKGRGKLVVNFKNLDALQGVLDKIKS